MTVLITEEFAAAFAAKWIAAWNARDLNEILAHYAREIEFTSPFVSRFMNGSDATLRGVAVLRVYFTRALNAYPDLRFVLQRALVGPRSIIIEYQTVSNRMAAEMMEFNDDGLICRAWAHYAARSLQSGE